MTKQETARQLARDIFERLTEEHKSQHVCAWWGGNSITIVFDDGTVRLQIKLLCLSPNQEIPSWFLDQKAGYEESGGKMFAVRGVGDALLFVEANLPLIRAQSKPETEGTAHDRVTELRGAA